MDLSDCPAAGHACDCGPGLQGILRCDASGAQSCDCESAIATTAQNSCLTPCGGDLVGEWTLSAVCRPEYPAGSCANPERTASSALSPSALRFTDAGHSFGALSFTIDQRLEFPSGCPLRSAAPSCQQAAVAWSDGAREPEPRCEERSDCECSWQRSTALESDGVSYSTAGTVLTWQGTDWDYCASGDELRLRNPVDQSTLIFSRGECPASVPFCNRYALPFAPANLGWLGGIEGPTVDLDVNGERCDELLFNTDTLEISCDAAAVRAEARMPADGPEIAVFYFQKLVVRSPGEVRVVGSRPLAIVAHSVEISAEINFGGQAGSLAPLTAHGSDGASDPNLPASGSGGGHCTSGGSAGSAAGGIAFDDATSTVLWPGAPGGRNNRGEGGANAGAAVQIIAATQILIASGAVVSVAGQGELVGAGAGGMGGGSGGTLILEAPEVTVLGTLRAMGGPGHTTVLGSDGSGPGQDASGSPVNAGGGGGAGKILIRAGQAHLDQAQIVPALSTPCARLSELDPTPASFEWR